MLISSENLSGGYGDQPVIRHLDLAIQPGEWLSLLGANGSGKSTLLKLMGRLLTPSQGCVLLDGAAIHRLPTHIVAQQLALMPQQQEIPIGMSVEQLVSLGRTPHQPWWQWEMSATDRQYVDWAIREVALWEYRHLPVNQLSGGERQRALLALALAQEPQILFLDEPTTFLDLHYQLELLEVLQRLNRTQNLTIVTVLHEINLAARYSDRLAMLKEGRLWALGETQAVLTPENLRAVFDIETEIIQTSVGPQVLAIASIVKTNAVARTGSNL